MGRETVSSSNVTGQRCIHSRHCALDRPDVFVPNVKGAWIHPERSHTGGSAGAGTQLPLRCHPVPAPTTDGPLHVSGPLEVVSGTGHTIARVTYT